tara:strand:- start:133 stop:381 length:249 start_codon:yes stop_codon:yes gene_type:complete
MSNKFEKQALNQVNMINEGVLFGILKFFLKSKAKRQLRKLGRDPEFKSKVHALNHASKELQDFLKKEAEEAAEAKRLKKSRR